MANNLNELNFNCNEVLQASDLNLIVSNLKAALQNISDHETLIQSLQGAVENIVPGGGGGGQGNTGSSGVSTIMAFKGFISLEAANSAYDQIKEYEGIPGGWATTSNASLNDGEMLFMIVAYRQGNTWQKTEGIVWLGPYRLGSSGTTSGTGTDSSEYNYIYCRTTEASTAPSDIVPSDNSMFVSIMNQIEAETPNNMGAKGGYNKSGTRTSEQGAANYYYDHPFGITTELPCEWTVCLKNTNGTWAYHWGPVCTSHWGQNGLDGDGLEYIFYLQAASDTSTPTLTSPYSGSVTINGTTTNYENVAVNSPNYLQDDFIPTDWHDEPQEVSNLYPRLFVSTRKKTGALELGNLWGHFTNPKLWNVYATNGGQVTLDNDSIIIDDNTSSDAIEYVSLTKAFLWDGLTDVTFDRNRYPKITVTMTCSSNLSSLLTPCKITGLNGNDVITTAISWGTAYNLGTAYDLNNSNFSGFCVKKTNTSADLPKDTGGSISYTIHAYESINSQNAAVVGTKSLSFLIVDFNNGTSYSLLVQPNTLPVSRIDSEHPYQYSGSNSINITATGATGTEVEQMVIRNSLLNASEGDLYVVVKKRVGGSLLASGVLLTEDNNLHKTIIGDLTGESGALVTSIESFEVELYYKYSAGSILVDSETVDFSIKGDLGPAGISTGGSSEIFVISSVNDGAIIDDLTIALQDVINATLNPLKVYKGNTDVTLYCTFTPGTVAGGTANLPNGMSIIDLTTTTDSTYSTYKNTYCGSNGTYANRHVFVLSSVGLQLGSNWVIGSNYFYDVDIVYTDPSTSDTIFAGTKVFKLQIDSDISDDGSYYKLIITNDELSYNADGNLISNTLPTISVYNYHGSSEALVLVTPVATLPSPPVSDTVYLVLGDLYNYRNVNAASTLVTLTGYVGSDPNISQGSTIPYNIDGYMILVRKGTKYLDSPEVISCLRIGAKGDFLSRVFTRTNLDLSSLIISETSSQVGSTSDYYNTYDYPIPPASTVSNTTITWSDGIPSGTGALWSSYCIFYGAGGKSNWSTPMKEIDTESTDIEYNFSETDPGTVPNKSTPSGTSTNSWYDPSDESSPGYAPNGRPWSEAVWRAERKVKNGEYVGSWVVTRIKGERGPAGQGQGTESYIISSSNDGAIIDDQTDSLGLIQATINPIKIWKGNTDITSNCSFEVQNNYTNLPSGMYVVDLSANSSTWSTYYTTYNSLYSGCHLFFIGGSLSGGSTWTSGTYNYTIKITDNTDSNNPVIVGYLKFELYIDATISATGSYYKLYIENDELHFDKNGTMLNSSNDNNLPIIGAREIDLEGNGWNIPLYINVVSSMSTNNVTANELYLEVGSLSFTKIPNSLDYKLSSSPSYLAGGYNIKLYKGLNSGNPNYKLVDRPEIIICTKDGADGLNGVNGGDGRDGRDGVDATLYEIIPSENSLHFNVDDLTNGWIPSNGFNLTCTATKTVGSTVTTIGYNYGQNDNLDGYYLYYKTFSGTTQVTNDYTQHYENNPITISPGDTGTRITTVVFYLKTPSGNPIKSCVVPVTRDGKKGQDGSNSTGSVGRFYYFAGDWNEISTLKVTPTSCPYVYLNGKYYMYIGNLTGNDLTRNSLLNGGDDPSNSNLWEEMEYNRYAISDAMFANYAHLGSLVINRDWMISLYGYFNNATETESDSYTYFDPISFMYDINKTAKIGVIYGDSSSTNNIASLIFKLNGSAKATITFNGIIKLFKFNNSSIFRFNNSGTIGNTINDLYKINTDGFNKDGNYVLFTPSGGTSTDFLSSNNGTETKTITISSDGAYCFVGGNISKIEILYSNNLERIFIPHFALDLRSGFLYTNNAYVRGDITATSFSVLRQNSTNKSIEFTAVKSEWVDPNDANFASNKKQGMIDAGLWTGDPVGLIYDSSGNMVSFFDFAPVNTYSLSLSELTTYNIVSTASSGAITNYAELSIDKVIYYVNNDGLNSNLNGKYVSNPRNNSLLVNNYTFYLKIKSITSVKDSGSNTYVTTPLTIFRLYSINLGVISSSNNYIILENVTSTIRGTYKLKLIDNTSVSINSNSVSDGNGGSILLSSSNYIGMHLPIDRTTGPSLSPLQYNNDEIVTFVSPYGHVDLANVSVFREYLSNSDIIPYY